MPWIRMIHKGVNFPTELRLREIEKELKIIVAENLTCSDRDGALRAADIEFEVKVSATGDSLHEQYAVMFHIEANDFPMRKATLNDRTRRIVKRIGEIPEFKGMKGFVWVKLFPASFVEFGA